MNRKEKENVVAGLNDLFAQAKAVILTDFQGLKVGQMSELRRKIGEAGGSYQVAKNTLIKRAAQGTSVEVLGDQLMGNNALTTTVDDPAALAKALVDFAKDNDKLVIKAGVLEGKPLNFDQIKAIASLPAREVLLAQLLGAMNAVPTGLVRVLAAVPQGLLTALTAIRDQKEEQAA